MRSNPDNPRVWALIGSIGTIILFIMFVLAYLDIIP